MWRLRMSEGQGEIIHTGETTAFSAAEGGAASHGVRKARDEQIVMGEAVAFKYGVEERLYESVSRSESVSFTNE